MKVLMMMINHSKNYNVIRKDWVIRTASGLIWNSLQQTSISNLLMNRNTLNPIFKPLKMLRISTNFRKCFNPKLNVVRDFILLVTIIRNLQLSKNFKNKKSNNLIKSNCYHKLLLRTWIQDSHRDWTLMRILMKMRC